MSLVTGANHGIGAATARVLAAAGASVLLSYLRLDAEPDASMADAAEGRSSHADAVKNPPNCGGDPFVLRIEVEVGESGIEPDHGVSSSVM